MKTVTETLGASSAPLEYTTKEGKLIKIYALTLKKMSAYEQKMTARAIKTLCDSKPALGNEMFKELFKELLQDIDNGVYVFAGEKCSNSLKTITGMADLIGIMCDMGSDEALELVMKEKETFVEVWSQVVKQSIGADVEPEGEGVEIKK